jgi:hypothetical protein
MHRAPSKARLGTRKNAPVVIPDSTGANLIVPRDPSAGHPVIASNALVTLSEGHH